MTSRKPAHQVWHVSRGIVFSGGSSVVYPRLPSIRNYNAPAAVTSEDSSVSAPSVLSAAETPGELSASKGADDQLGTVMTTSTMARTRTSTSTTATTTTTTTTTTASVTTTTSSTTTATSAVSEGVAVETQRTTVDWAEKPKPKNSAPVVVPFTPLDFKIPDDAFRAARRAPKGSPESFWNYSLYRGPGANGALDTKVRVHYCTSMHTTERVIKQYFMNEKVIGFDLEWMSNAQKSWGPRKNVSLIQLASPSRIGLFHIASFPPNDKLVSPALKKLMEDPAITKVGVWIKGDCTRLAEYLKIETQGQFELSHLYKLVKYSASGEYGSINKKLVSLATQVKECLGLPIFKGEDVRISNWARRLTMDQIIYSSSDAYAAVQLYAVLNHQRQKLDPVPNIPYHAELNLPIPVARPTPPATSKAEDADPGAAEKQNAAGVGTRSNVDNTLPAEPSNVKTSPASRLKPDRRNAPLDQPNIEAKPATLPNVSPLAIMTQHNERSEQPTAS
ncbi:ribonuclease H-like domain-containing protein [Corynascus novoguineensis]|uniref:Ribonuclease H-like domain-containing protein n=1 Tax=Corynascus novoguineensis TaxID=1126955 RepID=A0AAN7HTG2_9PEZI|nr:ribonuclease H-like domain-containing protein [Corynascus novoguineensis]